jgi:endonuclease YncB( thermonuclease family)
MKGSLLMPTGKISLEAKEKLKKLLASRELRMKKILDDYKTGKLRCTSV